MVIAIGLLLTLLGRGPRVPAAIVGGVGFGFFIDELGKFITEDNNYFFEPAAALIYLFVTRAFAFVKSQFAAVFGLGVSWSWPLGHSLGQTRPYWAVSSPSPDAPDVARLGRLGAICRYFCE
jgi:hypothetical protein